MKNYLIFSLFTKLTNMIAGKFGNRNSIIKIEADNDSQISLESIDEDPIEIDGSLHIFLKKQRVMLVFDANKTSGYGEITLTEVIHLYRMQQVVYLSGRQIIEPLSIYCGIPLEESIVHYTRSGAIHFRIGIHQCHRHWKIEGKTLRVFDQEDSNESWKISLTNQNNWSTY